MACAIHGLNAICGPDCGGYIHDNSEAVDIEPTEAPRMRYGTHVHAPETVGPDPEEIGDELTADEVAAVEEANEGPTEH